MKKRITQPSAFANGNGDLLVAYTINIYEVFIINPLRSKKILP
jgi:hypothetical protein